MPNLCHNKKFKKKDHFKWNSKIYYFRKKNVIRKEKKIKILQGNTKGFPRTMNKNKIELQMKNYH